MSVNVIYTKIVTYKNKCHWDQNAKIECSDAIFLVMCDPSMNELRAIYTVLCIDLYGSRSLTDHS
jgi:hypothetical protein